MTIEQLQEELAKLREDYNRLERDFDSMSEGYQESLLLFDQLEETCHELEETNRMLQAAGVNELYVKDRRDAIIIFSLEHGYTLMKTNEELYRFGEKTID